MPQPYNYAIDVAAPFQSAVQGLQLGRSLEEMQVERQQRAMQLEAMRQKMAQAEAEARYQQQMNADLGELAQKGGNATGADYAAIITKYPQLSEHFRRGWEILSPEQQQARIGNASRVLAAISEKKIPVAVDELKEQAAAARNSGKDDEARAIETMIKTVETSPQLAQQMLEMQMVVAQGPDKFTENWGKYKMLPEDIANVRSQIKARDDQTALGLAKLAQDRREAEAKPSGMEKLTDSQRNAINAASTGAIEAAGAASQLNDLADRFESMGRSYGALSSASEAAKKLTGNQNYITELRTQYARMRNSEAIKSLPKGPASDKDIAMAMEGFLPATADPKTVASFLRGMAKLRKYEEAFLYSQAEWHANVGHLGKSSEDFSVDGVLVPKGTTYANFAPAYLKSKKAEIEGVPSAPTAKTAPTTRTPPAAPKKPKAYSEDDIAATVQEALGG